MIPKEEKVKRVEKEKKLGCLVSPFYYLLTLFRSSIQPGSIFQDNFSKNLYLS